MKRLFVAVAFAFVIAAPGAVAQDYSKDHLQAAEELLNQIDMQNLLATSIDAMLSAQMEQNPQLAQFEDVMRSFMRKYMSWQRAHARIRADDTGASTRVER